MQNLSKLHGVLGIGHQNPISATEQKKWMQYQSITIHKLFMDGMFAYLIFFFPINIICIFKMESNLY
jgi:hypothetical protein